MNLTNMNITELNNRIAGLQAKMVSADTTTEQLSELQKEFLAIISEIHNRNVNAGKELQAVKDKVTSYHFSIKDIFGDNAITQFSDVEIAQAIKDRGLSANEKSPGKHRKAPVDRVFKSDNNPVLLFIPRQSDDHHQVPDVTIRQGRANEYYTGKSIFAAGIIPKPLLRCKGQDAKETQKNLAKFITNESKDYKDKDVELEKIAEAVFKFVPKVKPAKGTESSHN